MMLRIFLHRSTLSFTSYQTQWSTKPNIYMMTHFVFEWEDALLAGNGGALVAAPIAGVLVLAHARRVPRAAAPRLNVLRAHVATPA